MTNVPTLGFVIIYVMILAIVPFSMGFISSLILFKSTKTSFVAGISSLLFYLVLLKSSFSFFEKSLIAAFISCALTGAAIYGMRKWDIPVISLNITDKLNFINRKTITALIVTGLLLIVVLSYGYNQEKEIEFSAPDGRYDVMCQRNPGSEISGYEHIDILLLNSTIVEDSVVLEMELAGNASEKDTVDYNFFIFTNRYEAPSRTISKWEMEKDGNVLRGYVPLEIAENGKIFYVQATASESNFNYGMGIDEIYDTCSKEKALGGNLESLDSFIRMLL